MPPLTRAILRLRNSGKLLFRSIRFMSILFHGEYYEVECYTIVI